VGGLKRFLLLQRVCLGDVTLETQEKKGEGVGFRNNALGQKNQDGGLSPTTNKKKKKRRNNAQEGKKKSLYEGGTVKFLFVSQK